MAFSAVWTQFFPPRNGAPLTEANLPSQTGKVCIVTGGSSGLGYELSRILYGAGATVYMLTRSREHADGAITRIKAFYDSKQEDGKRRGRLEYIHMDLMDLASVRTAAQEFLDRQPGRLDILFNNAGTAARKNAPPTAQGSEYHFGINVLGGFLLAKLLAPILSQTARHAPAGSVRVVWPASLLVEMSTPKGGIGSDFLRGPAVIKDPAMLYSMSKAANWFVASEFARRQPRQSGDGGGQVLHISGNPGNYLTNIWRDTPALLFWVLWPILRNPVHGAETYLFMGVSESVTLADADAGRYVVPDGRWHPGGMREDLLLALRSVDEGGSGRAAECFDWCEEKVREFL